MLEGQITFHSIHKYYIETFLLMDTSRVLLTSAIIVMMLSVPGMALSQDAGSFSSVDPNCVNSNAAHCLDQQAIDSARSQYSLTVRVDGTTFQTGNVVTVSGVIRTVIENQSLSLIIISDTGSRVNIGQINPSDLTGGTFSKTFTAGPKWDTSGQYTVKVKYGAEVTQTTFTFTATGIPLTPPTTTPTPTPDPVAPTTPIAPPPPPPPPPPPVAPIPAPVCGTGTVLKNGQCVSDNSGGGCLIATATFGTEMAKEVQMLRELRDNTLLQTDSGASFMGTFNDIYYTFSPTIADMERQSPEFKELVRIAITPMISSLAIMSYADGGSDSDVLGLGILVIALNIGMYVAVPTGAVIAIRRISARRTL